MRTNVVCLLAAWVACSPATPPSVTLVAKPRSIDNGGGSTELTATAIGADGQPGKGSVTFTSAAGSLKTPDTATLSAEGSASTGFSCDVNADPACVGMVRVIAEWHVGGETVGAALSVTLGGTGGAGGSGGSGGSGAGIGGGTGGSGFGSRTRCTGSNRPGVTARCCENILDAGINGPPCDFFGAVDGETILAPYRDAAGNMISVPLKFTIPSGYGDVTTCGMVPGGFIADLSAWDAGTDELTTGCSMGGVTANGAWESTGSGGCFSMRTHHPADCALLYPTSGTPALGLWYILEPLSDDPVWNGVTLNGTVYWPAPKSGTRRTGYYWVHAR